MLKIGITGVNGFVGNAVYNFLKSKGYDVVGFSRRIDNGEFVFWDIEKGKFEGNLQLDALVHSAGTVNDWAKYPECYQGNVVGTKNVLASFPALKKFIYISSFSVYDPKNKDFIITEESPCGNFMSAYSNTKYQAERLVLADDHIQQKVILRPHIIYGKGDKKILPRLLESVRFGAFPILGDGENTLSITHVENLCQAIELSINTDLPEKNNIFNIADEKSISLNTLINFIKQKFHITVDNFHVNKYAAYALGYVLNFFYRLFNAKNPPVVTPFIVAQITSNHSLSIVKAQKILGYKPTKSYLDIE